MFYFFWNRDTECTSPVFFFYCAWYYNALIVRYITAHIATRWIMRHFSFMLIYTKSIVCIVLIGC